MFKMFALLMAVILLASLADSASISVRQSRRLASPQGSRTIYLSAERILWDYAPSGRDLCSGSEYPKPVSENFAVSVGQQTYKAMFLQYTSAAYSTREPEGTGQKHLGLFGPVIHTSPGDVLTVVVRNQLSFPINVEPSGVLFDSIAAILPNANATFTWRVTDSACSNAQGLSSTLWLYRSTLDLTANTQAGLLGGLVCVAPDMADPATGRPTDIDREFFMMLQVYDESKSSLVADNLALYNKTQEDLEANPEAFLRNTINGYMLCNQPGVQGVVGDRVRFYSASIGGAEELHTLHWHGIVLNVTGGVTDIVQLQSGSIKTADALLDNPGVWFMHCHVNKHFKGGMTSLMTIDGTSATFQRGNSTTRDYFIAVELVDWDYTPQRQNLCEDSPRDFTKDEEVFLKQEGGDAPRVGSVYKKLVYVEYTDANFTTRKVRSGSEQSLGLLGPLIRGEVGDVIQVTLRNGVPDLPCTTIHPHGVRYLKDSEGALYNDSTSGTNKLDDCVTPNATHVYTWHVADESGPLGGGSSSQVWLYHGHRDEQADTYAGLVGGLVITRRGAADANAKPLDVDSEHVLLFHINNEQISSMWPRSAAAFLPAGADLATLEADEEFQESNLMHNINGYMYCNLPGMNFALNSRVRLHLMALGSELDMHTPYAAAASLTSNGWRMQAIQVLPGGFISVDFSPSVMGHGVLSCHVNDHLSGGMVAAYNVTPPVVADNTSTLLPGATLRTAYLAAEVVTWDYLPGGVSLCGGAMNDQDNDTDANVGEFYATRSATRMGSSFLKAVYRQYADAKFTQAVSRDPYLGFMGPTLTAAVGERLRVVLMNSLPFTVGFRASGGLRPITSGGVDELLVEPNSVGTIDYYVDVDSGPAARDGDSVLYSYLSAADPIGHTHAGLVGALLVTRRGVEATVASTTAPAPVADTSVPPLRSLPLVWTLTDESQSPLFEANKQAAAKGWGFNASVAEADEDFADAIVFRSVAGYLACTGPPLTMQVNETVRLLMLGVGSEADQHSPTFPGQQLQMRGTSYMSLELMPGLTAIATLRAATPGEWVYYCNVLEHNEAGMQALMNVTAGTSLPESSPPPPIPPLVDATPSPPPPGNHAGTSTALPLMYFLPALQVLIGLIRG